ncbi:MAG TPA: hypothetical protein VFX67_11215, partial [Burkholderiales bacterium]|nr:hypothetical protein [Burkholderiales bacterium]
MRVDELAGAAAPAAVAGADSLAARLRWRWNRLRCMSPAEVAHRVFRLAAMQAERARAFGPQRIPAPQLGKPAGAWVPALPEVDPEPYLVAARRIAAGRLDVFALKDVFVGAPPRWNRDPKTGIEAPLRFGKLLDYRDSGV